MSNCGCNKNEDLRKWFGKGGAGGTTAGGWDRYGSDGQKLGKCGDAKAGEPYSACLSAEKARKLGKKGIANFVKRKRAAQKKSGDAKKGGEQKKGQKPTYVKTENKNMKQTQLRKLIRESIKHVLIQESLANVKDFRNMPSDPPNESMIRMILMRKVDGRTAVYRLEKDNWFRRYETPGKGHGLMIRKFRMGKNPIKVRLNPEIGSHHSVFNALITYLPTEFDNTDDDIPANYETVKGYVFLGTKAFTGVEMQQKLSPKDIEAFVKMNVPNYTP